MDKGKFLAMALALPLASLAAPKGTLVLQTGSDWCVSGEEVREVFEGKEFARTKTAQLYTLCVYDDMDAPTDAVKAKNEALKGKGLVVRTKRFPAITCFTPSGKVFAQIENVPNSVTAEKLAKAVAKQTKRKDEAEKLFAEAAKKTGEEAADLYGQGFDILASMMGPFHFKALTDGDQAWTKEWTALSKLDAGDKYGWLAHFRMDEHETVKMVEKVTTLKAESSSGQAAAYVDSVKRIPDKHFTPNQKQCVLVMQYALSANGTDKKLNASEKQLIRSAFDLGRETFWGQFAMGRLIMDGEKIESKGLPAAKVVPRPKPGTGGIPADFALERVKSSIKSIKPGAPLDEKQKLAIARYAVLRLIGQEGWKELVSRLGSGQFVKAFMNDRVWLEDFAWSGTFEEKQYGVAGAGPGDGAGAILALESLVYQDKGRWCGYDGGKYEDNEGRRCMTALALNFPGKDEAWYADVLDAYRATALAGRLHKSAYTQPVWMWRFATHQGHPTGGADNVAAQQRHFDKFVNVPCREYASCYDWLIYRMKNCFGDSVHGPYYYKAWATANEWPKRKYSQIVGGVCGELSKYGSAMSNAHGLPSTTVGQPGHCAYSRRRPTDGKWEIDNSVTGHSQLHLCFWGCHEWQYVAAMENMFSVDRETRLDADRILALATLAEELKRDDKTIESYFQRACNTHHGHFGAWKAYGEWLMRTGKPLDKIKVWVKGCAKGLKAGRQPLWNILTPYFNRVAKEQGAAALKDNLVEFAPLLKQAPDKLQEEADFKTVLDTWGDALGGDAGARYDVLKAMLAAQFGTSDYFSQTMGWGSDYFSKSADGVAKFNQCLSEALEEAGGKDKASKGKKGKGGAEAVKIDFAPLILSASRNGNLGAFRQMVKLQRQMSPVSVSGQKYPASDFGGELIGAEGMLRTSTTSNFEHPERYALCIDSSPCGEGAFHTSKETAPWAEVTLPGNVELAGIVVENRFGNGNNQRQVPLVVSVSEDGQSWQDVKTFDSAQDTYRIDLKGQGRRARYVKVGRKPGAKEDFFHLNKILVYGKKLW